MLHHPLYMLATATAMTLAGCFGTGRFSGDTRHLREEGRSAGPNAIVLEGKDLGDRRGSLLDAMVGRVPILKVNRAHPCPALALRGQNTVPGVTEPKVYVDGTRAQDTCVLTGLRAVDVERVEIYPLGVTSRPGYDMHSRGLILVFLRDGT